MTIQWTGYTTKYAHSFVLIWFAEKLVLSCTVWSIHSYYLRLLYCHGGSRMIAHYDVIEWKPFLHYWPFVRGIPRSPANSPHKSQWHGALMFYLICTWTNGWVQSWRRWFETLSHPLWRHNMDEIAHWLTTSKQQTSLWLVRIILGMYYNLPGAPFTNMD